MRGSIRLLLAGVVLAGFARPLGAQAALRYDGIYQSQEDEWMEWGRDSVQVWSYLRFTPDGLVISFTTTGRPDGLGSFSLANPMLPVAGVTLRDGRISFTVSDCGGTVVDYDGRIEGDRLYLHVRSNYNGYQADRVFAFVPVPAERRRQWDGAGGVENPCAAFDNQGR